MLTTGDRLPPLITLTTNDMLALCQLDTAQLEAEIQRRCDDAAQSSRKSIATSTTNDTGPVVAGLLRAHDADRRSLLHWAALQGRREHVEYLLEVLRKTGGGDGVDVLEDIIDARDDSGNTPLNLASLKGMMRAADSR